MIYYITGNTCYYDNRSIVGSTKDNRWIPMTFDEDAFLNAPGLQELIIQRLGVKSVKYNIFPSNLTSL